MSLPRFSLFLSPLIRCHKIDGLRVRYIIEQPAIPGGRALLQLPWTVGGVPGMPLGAADLTVTDNLGKLALTQHDKPTSTSVGMRRWLADRDTAGDLVVEYLATPRAVDESTQMGPLFDLRTEPGGLIGAGVTFLALPVTDRKHDITLQWDLSGAPAGTRASTSLGEGPIRITGTVKEVASSFYAAGQLRSYPDDARGPFAMYWITEPNFDPAAVARLLHQIYLGMCCFFREIGRASCRERV